MIEIKYIFHKKKKTHNTVDALSKTNILACITNAVRFEGRE